MEHKRDENLPNLCHLLSKAEMAEVDAKPTHYLLCLQLQNILSFFKYNFEF